MVTSIWFKFSQVFKPGPSWPSCWYVASPNYVQIMTPEPKVATTQGLYVFHRNIFKNVSEIKKPRPFTLGM